ncbi:hypothetical protein EDC01DRAFT_787854 [Geopyxis carbonaria]|nr:hypothetical protein EDC01DRAFT_787854 [Geopyxis carbonaria]
MPQHGKPAPLYRAERLAKAYAEINARFPPTLEREHSSKDSLLNSLLWIQKDDQESMPFEELEALKKMIEELKPEVEEMEKRVQHARREARSGKKGDSYDYEQTLEIDRNHTHTSRSRSAKIYNYFVAPNPTTATTQKRTSKMLNTGTADLPPAEHLAGAGAHSADPVAEYQVAHDVSFAFNNGIDADMDATNQAYEKYKASVKEYEEIDLKYEQKTREVDRLRRERVSARALLLRNYPHHPPPPPPLRTSQAPDTDVPACRVPAARQLARLYADSDYLKKKYLVACDIARSNDMGAEYMDAVDKFDAERSEVNGYIRVLRPIVEDLVREEGEYGEGRGRPMLWDGWRRGEVDVSGLAINIARDGVKGYYNLLFS